MGGGGEGFWLGDKGQIGLSGRWMDFCEAVREVNVLEEKDAIERLLDLKDGSL